MKTTTLPADGRPGAGEGLRLVADIGGTNARFALSTTRPGEAKIEDVRVLPTGAYPGPAEAALAYLDGRGVEEAVLGVACPVEDDRVSLTNHPWTFSVTESGAVLGARLAAINDFAAQALALPAHGPGDLEAVGGGAAEAGKPMLAIGPGTGLGLATLVPWPGGDIVLPGEGGHASFPPGDEREIEVLKVLLGRMPHVSAERLVSGPGLLTLALTLAEIDGGETPAAEPSDVSAFASSGGCPYCVEAASRFSGLLGGAAGDAALTVGARGGVYVCGGVVRGLGAAFDRERFRARFEAKGRLGDFLRPIPTWIVDNPRSGLLGAARYRFPEAA